MAKAPELKCTFDKVSGDAIIYKGATLMVMGFGLKDTKETDWLYKHLPTVKIGEEFKGVASIPGVGDPNKSKVDFYVQKVDRNERTCSVPELGINSIPVVSGP